MRFPASILGHDLLSNRLAMRFAYIDSNGNEIPIPSVDALSLRIELGAISSETQLYDGQADQWGPAQTHEIYHTLARAADGDDGFVAPPPVSPIPPPPPVVAEREADVSVVDLASLAGDDDELRANMAMEPHAVADPSPPAADQEFTLTEDSGLGLTLTEGPLDAAVVEEPEVRAADGFDFGDMEGGFEVEEPVEDPDVPLDVAGQQGPGSVGPDFGAMDLETTTGLDSAGLGDVGGGALDLETPMSEFSPEAPPIWMAPGGEEGADAGDVMDFSSAVAGSSGAQDDEDVPLRERTTSRNKPSEPKHRRQRNLAGPLVGVVFLLALGVGGYMAWPLLSARLASTGTAELPPVSLPDLPSALVPQMRSAGQATLQTLLVDARDQWSSATPVQSPPQQWLAGIYLANASDYGEVETFWDGISDMMSLMRSIDLPMFDSVYAAELERQGVGVAEGALMRARADSGFVAAAPARAATFDRVQDLVDASLRLHQFLVANESSIEYAPAAAVTTDPVLEVKPATDVIRASLELFLDDVTGSLSALNYREAVTGTGIWENTRDAVQATGIR